MPRSLRDKLGWSSDRRTILVDAPDHAWTTYMRFAAEPVVHLRGRFDHVHLFTKRAADLRRRLPQLKRHLAPRGVLWVSWPKGRGLGTDVTLRDVIRLAYDSGLVESKTIAFDDVWSAIKLTFPKPGRTYDNSYGRLPHEIG